jgi:UDPglucose--hexose-1-phosphate uridylyltransferase
MPELRKDPIIGRWVIIATERAKRPDQFGSLEESPVEGECPFCAGSESHTPPEIFAIRSSQGRRNGPGWEVRVIPSIAPFLKIEGDLDRRGRGLYDLMNGIGAHEIVIETNQYIANMADLTEEQIAKVITSYIERINDLEKISAIELNISCPNVMMGGMIFGINPDSSKSKSNFTIY